ncbi:hypothetical protein SEUBUCD646_0B05760 [Saccharomyces eubayanus]|uniref:SNM1-like protein n=1 Tax=Saccharomyces eubayanus TaxID=1080349 RepID=A0ABN8VNU1_SACEU|nr:hypothetical protein SEUBUCD650_0B05760 [Saccharomyces eubayanus]CAI1895036.1 hypothetical protein SEUBUCD646_0B05760 [Saccharomyces eubayanus]
MNRDQTVKYQERNLRQKYNMLHALPALKSKALSGLYYRNFHNSVKRYQVVLPEQLISGKFCPHCGCVYVPNFNATLQATTSTELDDSAKHNNEGRQTSKNCIEVRCLNCKVCEQFDWKTELAGQAVEGEPNPMTNGISARKIPQETEKLQKSNTKNKGSSGKDRSKKRKLTSLTNLLSKKNQEKNQKKNISSSLSLESFMKN